MKRSATIILLIIICAAAYSQENTSYLTYQLDVFLLVEDPEQAAIDLIMSAEENGGYFIHSSEAGVRVRVPIENLNTFTSCPVC